MALIFSGFTVTPSLEITNPKKLTKTRHKSTLLQINVTSYKEFSKSESNEDALPEPSK